MLKKNLQRYLKGSLLLNLPIVINTLIALVSLPIILSSLPTADYGKWQFILAIQAWIVTFSALNYHHCV